MEIRRDIYLNKLISKKHNGLIKYAYSAFLEVMLLENYSEDYQKSSVQSVVLKGLSKVSSASSKFIEKVPVISRTQLDEGLIEVEKRLSDFENKHSDKVMEQFINREQECVRTFKESIDMVNRLYNQDLSIAFSNDCLYIETA